MANPLNPNEDLAMTTSIDYTSALALTPYNGSLHKKVAKPICELARHNAYQELNNIAHNLKHDYGADTISLADAIASFTIEQKRIAGNFNNIQQKFSYPKINVSPCFDEAFGCPLVFLFSRITSIGSDTKALAKTLSDLKQLLPDDASKAKPYLEAIENVEGALEYAHKQDAKALDVAKRCAALAEVMAQQGITVEHYQLEQMVKQQREQEQPLAA